MYVLCLKLKFQSIHFQAFKFNDRVRVIMSNFGVFERQFCYNVSFLLSAVTIFTPNLNFLDFYINNYRQGLQSI